MGGKFALFFVILFIPNVVLSHSSGLDANGGHFNRKTGTYHCHRCPCGCPAEEKKEMPKADSRKCIRVIDGDTIVLDGNEKVRLIGVDTPETAHPTKQVERFGREASEFTKRMVEGKTVRLEYDQQRKDRFDRTLAYIYLEDGTFLNAEIIKQGYGFAYTKFPFKYLAEFKGHQEEAMKKKRDLWADD